MTLNDITDEVKLLQYISAALNDLKSGVSTQDETEWLFIDLLTHLIELDRKNRGYKLANGESKLPIA